jgi:hypothetical protein
LRKAFERHRALRAEIMAATRTDEHAHHIGDERVTGVRLRAQPSGFDDRSAEPVVVVERGFARTDADP